MRRKLAFILFLFFIGGCATLQGQGVGSDYWHTNRLNEIEAAYQKKEITESEYLSLKNEADKIRAERSWESHQYYCPYPRSRHYYRSGYYYHYRHHGHHY